MPTEKTQQSCPGSRDLNRRVKGLNEPKPKVMVVTRRKRRENKKVLIYLNNKPLEQVNNVNFMGIIIDSKLKFSEHMIQTPRKCSMLIHALAKSAKLS
jgi:hypothetical protein